MHLVLMRTVEMLQTKKLLSFFTNCLIGGPATSTFCLWITDKEGLQGERATGCPVFPSCMLLSVCLANTGKYHKNRCSRVPWRDCFLTTFEARSGSDRKGGFSGMFLIYVAHLTLHAHWFSLTPTHCGCHWNSVFMGRCEYCLPVGSKEGGQTYCRHLLCSHADSLVPSDFIYKTQVQEWNFQMTTAEH